MIVRYPFRERLRRVWRVEPIGAIWRMWRNHIPLREAIRLYHLWVWYGLEKKPVRLTDAIILREARETLQNNEVLKRLRERAHG